MIMFKKFRIGLCLILAVAVTLLYKVLYEVLAIIAAIAERF